MMTVTRLRRTDKMNSLHPATELMYFVFCIVIAAVIAETRLFDNPYFEYGTLIGIPAITIAIWRYRYKKIMDEMKKQKENIKE